MTMSWVNLSAVGSKASSHKPRLWYKKKDMLLTNMSLGHPTLAHANQLHSSSS